MILGLSLHSRLVCFRRYAIVICGVTGSGCHEAPLDPIPEGSSLIWSKEAFLLAPGWDGDDQRFYVAAGGVHAVDPESGNVIWESPGGRVGPEFQVVGGVVVVEQGGLKGLRVGDGLEIWNREDAPNGGVIGSVSEAVVVSTDGEVLAGLDLETGAERWRTELEMGGGVNLAVGEGVACAERLSPRGDGVVQCFSVNEGLHLWTRRMESAGSIAIAGGLLVLVGGENVDEPGWVAVAPTTGETVWKRSDLPLWRLAGESERTELLFPFDPETGSLIAVRSSDGSMIWQTSLGEKIDRVIVRSGKLVTVPPLQGLSVHVLDTGTGARRGTIVEEHEGVTGFCSGPAISGDRILMYGCGGFLLAYELP